LLVLALFRETLLGIKGSYQPKKPAHEPEAYQATSLNSPVVVSRLSFHIGDSALLQKDQIEARESYDLFMSRVLLTPRTLETDHQASCLTLQLHLQTS
jgi:hypothetical protein